MRNKDGRARRAWQGHGVAASVAAWLCVASSMVFVERARAGDPPTAPRSIVLAVAADTGCAVLDDGRERRLRCASERADASGVALVRIERDAAVFAIDAGQGSLVEVHVPAGQALDVAVLRERMADASGARPAWIEAVPDSRRDPQREQVP
jgi:hypothetical protein